MERVVVIFAIVSALASAETGPPFRSSGFAPEASGWTVWSDRPATAPRTWVEETVSRGQSGSLAVSGNGNIGVFGGWQRVLGSIEPGAWYRLTAFYRAAGVPSENWQILPRLDWRKANGGRAGEVDYAYETARERDWTKVTLQTQAPQDARGVTLQLFLAHAPQGTVWWDEVSFEKVPEPGPRPVTIAAINHRPGQAGSAAASVAEFVATADREAPAKVDLIVLPEGITVIGTGKRLSEVAEPIPGPTTATLGQLARKRSTYIVAGIYEREGDVIYNTAVLIDRTGKVAGTYRKVHLPREEMEQLAPGNDYPVFQTDFGTVGVMICYDVFFPDPARALAARGAEIVVLPIWGGDMALAKARAIDNQVYLVASGYDHPTYILSPYGEWIARAEKRGTAAIATIDLNKNLRYPNTNLGDMRNRRPKEMRVDVPVGVPGLVAAPR
jgi:predicted amidohydrolase